MSLYVELCRIKNIPYMELYIGESGKEFSVKNNVKYRYGNNQWRRRTLCGQI